MTSPVDTLLARAHALLESPNGAAVGNSARLAAVLTRQAVEELIDARCAELCGVNGVNGSARAKHAILKSLDDTAYSTVLIDAWHQLTASCHQHAYALSPTVREIRALCDSVRAHCIGAT
ncbi:hypothetical protein AXK60_24565 [Tsukamurella pseudospumae]|uniref:Uncharacterized protein n=1 Tax=Tsukamurella pseudospumae TaxID=239498 RepID=A0A138AN63_9ACTN|nr:hypothetical protein AXK60_24565 [Tsukamurella pseudospumae]